jgi:hypothetical protein
MKLLRAARCSGAIAIEVSTRTALPPSHPSQFVSQPSSVQSIRGKVHMKLSIYSMLAAFLLLESVASAGIGSHSTMYVGGTVSTIKERTEGKSSTADEKGFIFAYKRGKLVVPYERMNSVEYGQKAGRRLGLAIAVTPVALLSKKRKHFLTINYLDDSDKQQAIVLELGKDIVRTTLASLEARSGRKIEYQDEEARKSGKGN